MRGQKIGNRRTLLHLRGGRGEGDEGRWYNQSLGGRPEMGAITQADLSPGTRGHGGAVGKTLPRQGGKGNRSVSDFLLLPSLPSPPGIQPAGVSPLPYREQREGKWGRIIGSDSL